MHTDPTVLAELEQLEQALAGEPSPFSELVADVRAQRAVMSPAFEARLDARVDEARRKAPSRPSWLAWSPLAGLAAAVVVAVVLVGGGGSSTDDSASSGGSSAGSSAGGAAQSAPADRAAKSAG